jgi:hypothetical protein
MKDLIKKIVNLEWIEFQQVKNEGGKASCQENRETFEISRSSQFMAWSKELLESYFNDLITAKNKDWNVFTEKYVRMMESTSPQQYEELKDLLPFTSPEKKKMMEDIIQVQVKWAEEYAAQYTHLAGRGRPIHTYEDNYYSTSIETYLRGELGTYSEKTIKLYYDYVKQLQSMGKNLNTMIMENTVHAYGYDSLDAFRVDH